jgi:SAM-dependent methyltransferase
MGVVCRLHPRSKPQRVARQVLILVSSVVLAVAPGAAQRRPDFSKSLAPYVPSPHRVVDRMLELANPKQNETLYDLGCGDGRVLIAAAQHYNVKAVGIEISEPLVKAANENIRRLGLQSRIQVIQGDATTVNVKDADVVTLYLLTHSNEILRPNLEAQLRPGSRVVSHDFEIPGWRPLRVDVCDVHGRSHKIYLYEITSKKQ